MCDRKVARLPGLVPLISLLRPWGFPVSRRIGGGTLNILLCSSLHHGDMASAVSSSPFVNQHFGKY